MDLSYELENYFKNLPSRSLINDAACCAQIAHQGQYRKHFYKRPYFHHVAYVAGRVAAWGSPIEVAAAYLHDVLEDTSIGEESLKYYFGDEVTQIVVELTAYSKQVKSTAPRAVRKLMDLNYLKQVSYSAKRIKLVDRACNLEDYLACPITDFTLMYVEETGKLLEVLGSADRSEENYIQSLMDQINEVGLRNEGDL